MSQSRSIKGGTTDDGVSAAAFFFLLVKTLTFLAFKIIHMDINLYKTLSAKHWMHK